MAISINLSQRRLLLFFLSISALILSLWSYHFVSNLPKPWQQKLEYSANIMAMDGTSLRLFTTAKGYWRFPVQLQSIDENFISALIKYEDQRFYSHSGVDFISLLRALKQLLLQGRIVSGASTLSMQTIRLLQPKPRSLRNKFIEMLQAWRLESDLSKNEILQIYLSLAPYGGNIQGLQAASYFYFGKTARRLTYSEIALLIALPQAPEQRRPDRNVALAEKARNQVLERLYQGQIINWDDYQLGKKQPLPEQRQSTPFMAPQLSYRLKKVAKAESDYQLRSSIQFPLQLKLQQLADQTQKSLAKGETLAAIIVDNQSREVVAHLGSSSYWQASQLDLTQAIRSPGSTLKPFIYGLGFEKKLFHPQTRVQDQALRMADGYAPQNFDAKYRGQVNLSQALQLSLNIPAIKALEKVTPETLINRFKALGISLHTSTKDKAGLAIALGGAGISLENLTALYASLANQGRYSKLQYLSGSSNLRSGEKTGKQRHMSTKLLSKTASWYLDFILQGVPIPAGYEQKRHDPIRFKTGTSYGYRDVWSIGYNAAYTVGIWRGRPDGGFTQNRSGLAIAAPLLFDIFNFLPKNNAWAKTQVKPLDASLPGFAQLPANMQWLGEAENAYFSSKPMIQYPLDGSIIEMSQLNSEVLVLKAQAGTPPYHWLVNGQYFGNNANHREAKYYSSNEQQWQINRRGAVHITLIDSQGQQAHSEIWLKY